MFKAMAALHRWVLSYFSTNPGWITAHYAGFIEGASRFEGVYCLRTASNRVSIVRLSELDDPLPAQATLCALPFKTPLNAPNGSTSLLLEQAECYAKGLPSECRIGPVAAQRVIAKVPYQPKVQEAIFLYVLLRNDERAPSVESLVRFDLNAPPSLPRPIAAMAVGSPIRLIPGIPFYPAGDFKRLLAENPKSPSAIMHRTFLLEYKTLDQRTQGLAAFSREIFVQQAYLPISEQPRTKLAEQRGSAAVELAKHLHRAPAQVSGLGMLKITVQTANSVNTAATPHWALMKFPEAWLIAGGWGLVTVADSGIDMNHPALRSRFGTNSLTGTWIESGNFLPALSWDFASEADFIANPQYQMVDEREPVATLSENQAQCGSPPNIPLEAGHGTLTAGLVAGGFYESSGLQVQSGGCKHCGLSIIKISNHGCSDRDPGLGFNWQVYTSAVSDVALGLALDRAIVVGSQVYNSSFGTPSAAPDFCTLPRGTGNEFACEAIARAQAQDLLISSAAGNSRAILQFNAGDSRVAAIGGSNAAGTAIWNESPGSFLNCPNATPINPLNETECGSNFIVFDPQPPDPATNAGFLEFSTPAKAIRSLFYRGTSWNNAIGCGDSFGGGLSNDGLGLCTGTSMSTPQASAFFALLRSINPLVPAGNPDADITLGTQPIPGIRTVAAQTAQRAWVGSNETQGYGVPNAEAAVNALLGTVGFEQRLNRAIPLFRLYAPGAGDYASTAIPQVASALSSYNQQNYLSIPTGNSFIGASALSAYPRFPSEFQPAPPAIAMAFILSTEQSPIGTLYTKPLYWVARTRAWPLVCTSGAACNRQANDHVLVIREHVDALLNAGYHYRGRHGYLLEACNDPPTCNFINPAPPGSQLLYAACNNLSDCANALADELAAFAARGYSKGLLGAASPTRLSYAYSPGDADNDGLPTAVEIIAKTNPNVADSDGDGALDMDEYPLAGVPVSDPCNPQAASSPPDQLISDGFEDL